MIVLFIQEPRLVLTRVIVIAAIAAAVATQVPSLLHAPVDDAETPVAKVVTQEAQPVALTPAASGTVQLQADERGHYAGTFRVNGKSIDGLIDTGATYVAINESTARRLGFSGNGLDFRYAVNTANGQTRAAHISLDRMEIGTIRVRDVEAFVLRDNALSGTLVGMSFLKKLDSYRVAGGILQLKQ
ncbi:TIGR02281 family clan AA aspartic protease [Metarhizobium album]|uniref:TIGR02281 family clan AA aspartic protease n=1 Tax=Metarhizobium album TaxID=2182425 RepID=UPI001FE167AC|nr:TIGR02281 family clan AA aspartic protease [Rhizobium album]